MAVKWNSDCNVQRLRELHESGYSPGAIAREMGSGISRMAIYKKLVHLGLDTKTRDYKVSVPREFQNAWSDAEVETLLAHLQNPDNWQDKSGVYLAASKLLPGRNPESCRKKYWEIRTARSLNPPARQAPIQASERRSRLWSKEEEAKLREFGEDPANWCHKESFYVAATRILPGHTTAGVYKKYQKMVAEHGWSKPPEDARRGWSEAEVETLRTFMSDPQSWVGRAVYAKAQAVLPGRSRDSIKSQYERLSVLLGWERPVVDPSLKAKAKKPAAKKADTAEPRVASSIVRPAAPKPQEAPVSLAVDNTPPRVIRPAPVDLAPADTPLLLGLMSPDRGRCCWPFGDPGYPGFGWCNRRVCRPASEANYIPQGDVYCAYHLVKSCQRTAERLGVSQNEAA